jgi:pimeloyl-ACP methyl ester carboxylesterase
MRHHILTILAAGLLLGGDVPGKEGQEKKRGAEADRPVKAGMAEVAEPVLYYEECGTGEPVVLIHGGQLDRRMWDDQFQLFAKHYRMIRYDVRGYGKSETPTRPYSDVKDLHSLLNGLGVKKANLVGLSLGGRIAIDFALEHPDRVISLVGAGPGLSGFEWPAESEKRAWALTRLARDEGPEKAVEGWLKDPYMAPAMENPGLAPRVRRLALDNARCWLHNPLLPRGLDPPAARRLGEVRVSTLLVVGDRDVPEIQSIVKMLGKGIPHAKKVVIAGAGHMVNMEKPAEFNRAVLDFLKAARP